MDSDFFDTQGTPDAPAPESMWRPVLDPDGWQQSTGFSALYGPWRWVQNLDDAYEHASNRRFGHVPSGDCEG